MAVIALEPITFSFIGLPFPPDVFACRIRLISFKDFKQAYLIAELSEVPTHSRFAANRARTRGRQVRQPQYSHSRPAFVGECRTRFRTQERPAQAPTMLFVSRENFLQEVYRIHKVISTRRVLLTILIVHTYHQ